MSRLFTVTKVKITCVDLKANVMYESSVCKTFSECMIHTNAGTKLTTFTQVKLLCSRFLKVCTSFSCRNISNVFLT